MAPKPNAPTPPAGQELTLDENDTGIIVDNAPTPPAPVETPPEPPVETPVETPVEAVEVTEDVYQRAAHVKDNDADEMNPSNWIVTGVPGGCVARNSNTGSTYQGSPKGLSKIFRG